MLRFIVCATLSTLLCASACDLGGDTEGLSKRIDDLEAASKKHDEALAAVAEADKAREDMKARLEAADTARAKSEETIVSLEKSLTELQARINELETVVADATADAGKDAPPETDPSEIPEVVGIPECDEYLFKYRRCIEAKMPEASKSAVMDALDKSVEAWKTVAEGPGRSALAETCKTASQAAKKATEAMGCTW